MHTVVQADICDLGDLDNAGIALRMLTLVLVLLLAAAKGKLNFVLQYASLFFTTSMQNGVQKA